MSDEEPEQVSVIVSHEDFETVIANYRCGHCTARAEVATAPDGETPVIALYHDAGCPVLAGTLSPAPDAHRAVTAARRQA